MKIWL